MLEKTLCIVLGLPRTTLTNFRAACFSQAFMFVDLMILCRLVQTALFCVGVTFGMTTDEFIASGMDIFADSSRSSACRYLTLL